MQQPLPGPAAQVLMAPRPRTFVRGLPSEYRNAGVLLLLYPITAPPTGKALGVALTRRCDHLAAHAGQISFPGGLREPEDATLLETALREAREELGLEGSELEVLAALTPLEIPVSSYRIHPWVAYTPARPAFRTESSEVAELLEVPLDLLLDPATAAVERRVIRGYEVEVPFFFVQGHKVWGATAAVLSELLALLRGAVPA